MYDERLIYELKTAAFALLLSWRVGLLMIVDFYCLRVADWFIPVITKAADLMRIAMEYHLSITLT